LLIGHPPIVSRPQAVDDPEPRHTWLTVARSFVQDDDLPADLDQRSVDGAVGHTEARDDRHDDE
jgi:hypothetical protein